MWRKICEIDDPYWREIWKGKFQKEYDTVLQAVPNVGFTEFGEGDEEWEE